MSTPSERAALALYEAGHLVGHPIESVAELINAHTRADEMERILKSIGEHLEWRHSIQGSHGTFEPYARLIKDILARLHQEK